MIGRISDRIGRFGPMRASVFAVGDRRRVAALARRSWLLAALVVAGGLAFGSFWTPAMALLSDEAEARGLEYAYAFALINLAWAPGQALGSSGGGALAEVTADAVPYLLLSGACLLTFVVPVADPEAPRSEPRRDRAADLPRVPRARDRAPSPSSPRTIVAPCMRAPRTRPVEIRSYLDSEEHIRAAKESGADAIHPGYGFLAENADFAEAVEAAGLVFVGPSAEALRLGGDKLEAKRIAREAGVPVLPTGEPDEVGFPLDRQGGRRRRRARDAGRARARPSSRRRSRPPSARRRRRSATTASSASATSSGRATSRSSCSATATAACIALGERECSIQRRHQKVLEESPSPALDAGAAREMSEAAVRVRRAIGYRSAGTAEFMLAGPRLLPPRAQRPDPGRASGHRARDGRRPRRRAAPDRERRSHLVQRS